MSRVLPETETSDSRASGSDHQRLNPFWLLVALGVLLLAYPLSTGPAAKYYENKGAPKAVRTFYAPLVFLYERNESAHRALDWYARLWRTHF
ncbi:MAG TPA: hypothetical protein VLT36_16310 [Candidatus Dormibacteraeota bacterium]|nr:hypothetical protein [Candidatus Dormibacteraeota bacterium]